MRKNRLWIRILTLAFTVGLLLTATALASYNDTSGHWASDAIDKWSGEYGILQGYDNGDFRPDNTITRGAFAGIMVRFLQYQSKASAGTFSDIEGNYWADDILKLNQAGVYLGTDGKALVYNDITRQQAVTMIARAFGLSESSTALTYSDGNSVADYAKGYVSTMAASGFLTDVKSNEFRPTDAITRAEVVTILDNMIETLYQSAESYSKNVDGTAMVNATAGVTLSDMTIAGDLIVAPGVTGTVTLNNVEIKGSTRNLGSATINQKTTTPDKNDDQDTPNQNTTNPGTTTPEPSTPDTPNQGATDTNTTYIDYNGRQVAVLPDVVASKFSSSDFYWDSTTWSSNRLCCSSTAYTTRFGIDVSRYQGDIDWKAVASDGVEFAFVRIGGRGTSSTGAMYSDANYADNIDEAMAAGIDTGVYFFAQAITEAEAEEEADYTIKLLKNHQISGPVVYDWEMLGSGTRTYGISSTMATKCAITYCEKLRAAGYDTVLYFTNYVGYMKYDLSALNDYGFWYANYSYKYPNFYYQVDYWQYSSKGSIKGISGNVDCDLQFIKK